MSLSETEQPAPADIRADIAALHEEICYIRGQWPRLEAQVAELHAVLVRLRPLVDRYAASNGSPAARWARRRAEGPASHSMRCQGITHDEPLPGCHRAGPHGYLPGVGCHVDPAECNG